MRDRTCSIWTWPNTSWLFKELHFRVFQFFFSETHDGIWRWHLRFECGWNLALYRSLPNILWFVFLLCDLSCGSDGIEDLDRHERTAPETYNPKQKSLSRWRKENICLHLYYNIFNYIWLASKNLQRNVAPSERWALFPDWTTNDFALRIAKRRKRSQLAQFFVISHYFSGSILILWSPPNGLSYYRKHKRSSINKQKAAGCRTSAIEFFNISVYPRFVIFTFSLCYLRGTYHRREGDYWSRRSTTTVMELTQLHRKAHCLHIHNLPFAYFLICCHPFCKCCCVLKHGVMCSCVWPCCVACWCVKWRNDMCCSMIMCDVVRCCCLSMLNSALKREAWREEISPPHRGRQHIPVLEGFDKVRRCVQRTWAWSAETGRHRLHWRSSYSPPRAGPIASVHMTCLLVEDVRYTRSSQSNMQRSAFVTHRRWAHKSTRRRLTSDTPRKHPTVAYTKLVVFLRGKELLCQGGSWSRQRRWSPCRLVVPSEGIQSPQARRTVVGACCVDRQLVVALEACLRSHPHPYPPLYLLRSI